MCCSINCSNAQSRQPNYHFENITYEQGLPGRIVNTIIQDAKGFIWFGSEEGLTKFDGYSCFVYKHENADPHSLSDNSVYTLCLDGNGSLWIATHNGLNRYNEKINGFDVFHHDSANNNSIAADEIFTLAKDNKGSLWAGTYGGGLDKLEIKNSQYIFVHHQNSADEAKSISGNQVFSIAFDKKGYGWIGTYEGLNIIEPGGNTFYHFSHLQNDNSSITDNGISRISPAKDGTVWLCGYGMLDNAVFDATSKGLSVKHVLPIIKGSLQEEWVINDFIFDRYGNYWLATNDQGLSKFLYNDQKSLISKTSYVNIPGNPSSLASSNVYSIYEDRAGTIWIGTSKGVSKYIPSKELFNEYGAIINQTKKSHFVLALTADNQNRLWLATDTDSLQVIATGNQQNPVQKIISPILSKDGFDQVNILYKNSRGDIYMGTMLQGFFIIPASGENIYDRHTWIHISTATQAALPSDNIYSFAEDKDGNMLIGTYKGLCFYNTTMRSIEPVYTSPSGSVISDYIIRSVIIDKDNDTWCGTDNGIVILKNKIKLKTLKEEDKIRKLSNNNVLTLFKDTYNNIWAGTKEGLTLYKNGTDTAIFFLKKDGLPDDGIRSITEDKNNTIWIATNHGLAKYNTLENKFYSYTIKDGLNSDQFVTNSVCNGNDNILYFGTNNGLVSFKPDKIISNPYIPPVAVTQVKVMNKNIEDIDDTALVNLYRKDHTLKLNYNQNFFSFDFAALNYINTGNNQYAYKLDGVDKDWNYSGPQHFANYTDIKPGDYTFKVKASNNDGLWNEQPDIIHIIINPPWWHTWWFYLLCTLAFCSVLYIIYRVRLRQILQLYKLRSSIAKDLHDDVGSALSSIAMLSRLAQEGKTTVLMKPEEIYTRMGDTSKRMIDLMDDIVWSVNPDNDRFSNMLIRMREYAVEMLEPLNIDIAFKVSEDMDELRIPMQMRKDYFLIYKEAVNNLAKYSACTNATINIEKNGKDIITIVRDKY